MVKVELIYVALDGSSIQWELLLHEKATIADALNESQLYQLYPDLKGLPVGIFSKQMPMNTRLKTGDRIEIYRPLSSDPKEKRKLRVRPKKGKK